MIFLVSEFLSKQGLLQEEGIKGSPLLNVKCQSLGKCTAYKLFTFHMYNDIHFIFAKGIFHSECVCAVISLLGLGYSQGHIGVCCLNLVVITRRQSDIVTGPCNLWRWCSLEVTSQLNCLPFLDRDCIRTLENLGRDCKEKYKFKITRIFLVFV